MSSPDAEPADPVTIRPYRDTEHHELVIATDLTLLRQGLADAQAEARVLGDPSALQAVLDRIAAGDVVFEAEHRSYGVILRAIWAPPPAA